jgi:hypothetical protein
MVGFMVSYIVPRRLFLFNEMQLLNSIYQIKLNTFKCGFHNTLIH